MRKGIIFDVDGVLLDSTHIWNEIPLSLLKKYGMEITESPAYVMSNMSMVEGVNYLKTEYHLSASVEELRDEVRNLIRTFYEKQVKLKANISTVLEWLSQQKIPMVIATSSDSMLVRAALSRLMVLHYFKEILSCNDFQTGKDRPDIYLAAGEKLQLSSNEVIVIEDSYHAIQTAKKAGFYTVGVYDSQSENYQKQIEETADIYTKELTIKLFKELMAK